MAERFVLWETNSWFLDQQINAGIEPSKETLENLRRRCLRELDYKKDVQVDSLTKKFQIRMGS